MRLIGENEHLWGSISGAVAEPAVLTGACWYVMSTATTRGRIHPCDNQSLPNQQLENRAGDSCPPEADLNAGFRKNPLEPSVLKACPLEEFFLGACFLLEDEPLKAD